MNTNNMNIEAMQGIFSEAFYDAAREELNDEQFKRLRDEMHSATPWGAPWLWSTDWSLDPEADWYTAGADWWKANREEIIELINAEIAFDENEAEAE